MSDSSAVRCSGRMDPDSLSSPGLVLFTKLWLTFSVCLLSSTTSSQRPNIVVYITDDMGRADVSFTEGNLQTPTPHIDKLAWDGIILNRHYTSQLCTPTRAAFMTGKYNFHTGMNTAPISEGQPWELPLNFATQGDLFRQLGYQTWNVGKNRDFDYSYGIMGGRSNWFNYTAGWATPYPTSGRMLRENGRMIPANHTNNVYLPELLNNKAEQLIRNADTSRPFCLLYSTPVPHCALEPYRDVLHTMPQFQLRPSVLHFNAAYPERKKQLGIIQVLDESFKRLIDALVYKGVVNNTIIVFFADNGAPVSDPSSLGFVSPNYGTNWPLRSGKASQFEGGVRTAAFVWSPLLKRRGRITEQLFHLTDWLPTLWEAAGGDAKALPAGGDGYSHWQSFQSGLSFSGPRRELVIDINAIKPGYSLIAEDRLGHMYKLIGEPGFPSYPGWSRPQGTSSADDSWRTYSPAMVRCNQPEGVEITPCIPSQADCLFDLVSDPCELNNLANTHRPILQLMQLKLKAYNITVVPSVFREVDPRSNPNLWGGLWVPWLDADGEIYDAALIAFSPFNPSTAF